jgi:hypothetical protein
MDFSFEDNTWFAKVYQDPPVPNSRGFKWKYKTSPWLRPQQGAAFAQILLRPANTAYSNQYKRENYIQGLLMFQIIARSVGGRFSAILSYRISLMSSVWYSPCTANSATRRPQVRACWLPWPEKPTQKTDLIKLGPNPEMESCTVSTEKTVQ